MCVVLFSKTLLVYFSCHFFFLCVCVCFLFVNCWRAILFFHRMLAKCFEKRKHTKWKQLSLSHILVSIGPHNCPAPSPSCFFAGFIRFLFVSSLPCTWLCFLLIKSRENGSFLTIRAIELVRCFLKYLEYLNLLVDCFQLSFSDTWINHRHTQIHPTHTHTHTHSHVDQKKIFFFHFPRNIPNALSVLKFHMKLDRSFFSHLFFGFPKK